MWGILIGIAIYAVAMVVLIGKEGMREYNSKTVWTTEEIDKIKGSAVMGWKLLIVIVFLAGLGLLGYHFLNEMPSKDELSQHNGIVSKITDSGTGTVEFSFKDQKEMYVIRNDEKRFLDRKKLEKMKTTEECINILYRKEKSFLQQDQVYAVYDVKTEKDSILTYEDYEQFQTNMNYLWLQTSFMLFTIAILSAAILIYAKKNPKVYKIICIMKPEKAIKPTLSQKVSREVDDILTKNLEPKNGRIDAGYYGKLPKIFKNSDEKEQDL